MWGWAGREGVGEREEEDGELGKGKENTGSIRGRKGRTWVYPEGTCCVDGKDSGPAVLLGDRAAEWPMARALGPRDPQLPEGRGSEFPLWVPTVPPVCPRNRAALGGRDPCPDASADSPSRSSFHPHPSLLPSFRLSLRFPPLCRGLLGLQNECFLPTFIHKYLLSTYCVPVTVPGTADPAKNRNGGAG